MLWSGSTSSIAPFASPATKADIMKKRRGSSLSARPKNALDNVPTTNPAWTLLVNSEALVGLSPYSATSVGITAEAENQSAITATTQTESRASENGFEFIGWHYAMIV